MNVEIPKEARIKGPMLSGQLLNSQAYVVHMITDKDVLKVGVIEPERWSDVEKLIVYERLRYCREQLGKWEFERITLGRGKDSEKEELIKEISKWNGVIKKEGLSYTYEEESNEEG